MKQLTEFYNAIDESVSELAAKQPWWPCLDCPVIGQEPNCCNYAMFLVTKTEWEQMKMHPFIIKNRKRLKEDARISLQKLSLAGYDCSDWGKTVKDFGDNGKKFRCPLLSEDGWCQIYRDRPTICRSYGVSDQGDGVMYGCQIVVDEVVKRAENAPVQALPLKPQLEHLTSFSQGPTKPIVAWLAEL